MDDLYSICSFKPAFICLLIDIRHKGYTSEKMCSLSPGSTPADEKAGRERDHLGLYDYWNQGVQKAGNRDNRESAYLGMGRYVLDSGSRLRTDRIAPVKPETAHTVQEKESSA